MKKLKDINFPKLGRKQQKKIIGGNYIDGVWYGGNPFDESDEGQGSQGGGSQDCNGNHPTTGVPITTGCPNCYANFINCVPV